MAKEEKSRRAALYDHPASKKNEAAKESKPEQKPAEAKPEPKAEAAADESAGSKEADLEMAESKGLDKMLEGLKMLHRAHESERRDFHGNQREAMRQMATRHEKAIRELSSQMGSGNSPGSGEPSQAPEVASGEA